jgi:putative addiction module component (TIGR02574 family)
MTAIAELRSLPVDERLRLVEELWNSIAEDQTLLPDDSVLVSELNARRARYEADPSLGVSWPEAKERVRSGRA